MRPSLWAVTMVLALASPAARAAETISPPEAASPALSGTGAWAAMLGNTITGTTPDGDYTEFFKPDGTVVHVDRDGKLDGQWSVKDQSVCFTYPDDDETECRLPRVDGQEGSFTGVDGARYTFQLHPGNPDGL